MKCLGETNCLVFTDLTETEQEFKKIIVDFQLKNSYT